MKRLRFLALFGSLLASSLAQDLKSSAPLYEPRDYKLIRISSTDPKGGNADSRRVPPGETFTLMDVAGPGLVSHIWITIADGEFYHLKKIVLRMYWDGEPTPSVEAPVGDFFGLGLGDYRLWHSAFLSVGGEKALNSYFEMPFQKHARITITNEGRDPIDALYFNIDYRALPRPITPGPLYFHAQYRQAQPNIGWTNDWEKNWDPIVLNKNNLDGAGNYTWLEATGRGHFVGVTMSILQNQDGWWGEGDDMFFIDGERLPSIVGTGSEDYFLGAWDFGRQPFSYDLYGAPVIGAERAGERWSVYRFHSDSPITFSKSLRAGIEHGHANIRADNFYSVAYWYQTEPHAAPPPLPPAAERVPVVVSVSGPGNKPK